MTNEDLLSKTITYLRFPLAVGVTFIHFNLSDGLKINGIQHGLGNPDWFFFIVNFISEVLVRINVPLFFVISGFLFFYRTDFSETVYKHKLKSRAKTLLVPYLLWNSIAILWKLIFFLPVLSSFVRPVEIDLSFTRIINTFFFDTDNRGIFIGPVHAESSPEIYPINDPLWYVRDLMLMAICSPIIH
jgi:peptidoglycan/LPS O-acetylase OafA/YrhL